MHDKLSFGEYLAQVSLYAPTRVRLLNDDSHSQADRKHCVFERHHDRVMSGRL